MADSNRAEQERRYLKVPAQFAMHGISAPKMHALSKAIARELVDDPLPHAVALFDELHHDCRSLAIGILDAKRKTLSAQAFPTFVDFVRRSYTWAHVDWLMTRVASPLVVSEATLLRRLPKLARDESFWVRRASMLALHVDLRREALTFPLFAQIAGMLVHEREFFIRKAIGWSLREVSKRHPQLVYDFLATHETSGLTFREGAKYLPPKMRDALVARRT